MADLGEPLRHSGVMRCKCPHELGDLKAPLDSIHAHINTRCKWTCCSQPWNCAECTPAAKEGTGFVSVKNIKSGSEQDEPVLETKADDGDPTVISKAALELLAEDGYDTNIPPLPKVGFKKVAAKQVTSSASKTTATATASSSHYSSSSTSTSHYSSSSSSTTKTTTSHSSTTVMKSSYRSGSSDDWLMKPIKEFFSEINCFAPSVEFIEADSKTATIELMSDEMPESMFRRRVAMAVLQYMRMLKLPTSNRRIVELMTMWVVSAVQSWANVTGGHGNPTIKLGGPIETDPTFAFLRDFMQHIYGDMSREDSLRKAADKRGVLTEQAFIDWYVTSRYEVAIIPPDEDGFPFFGPQHTSSMAKVLQADPSLFHDNYGKKTQFGVTLDKVIQIGLNIPEDPIGCVAGDEFSYPTFPDFFLAVAADVGSSRTRNNGHMNKIDWDASSLRGLSEIPAGYVVSVSFQASRNIRGYPFPLSINRGDRRKVEYAVADALKSMADLIPGSYSSGPDMPNRLLDAPPYSRDWPYNRGIFKDITGSVSLVVNVHDHVCLTVDGKASGILSTFNRFTDILGAFETALFTTGGHGFVRDEKFGYHTSNPAIAGTGMVASITLKLPNLMKKNPSAIFNRLGLTYAIGAVEGTVIVSHKGNLGYSETELIQLLINGINAVLAMEHKLEDNDVTGCSLLIRSLAAKVKVPIIESSYRHTPGQAYIAAQQEKLNPKKKPTQRRKRKDGEDSGDESEDKDYEDFEDKDSEEEEEDEEEEEPEEGEKEEDEAEKEDGPFSHKDDFPNFTAKHKSLLVKHLEVDTYHELCKLTEEAGGWSIADAIRPAIDSAESQVGILLGGEESYEAYRPLLRSIISDIHYGFDTLNEIHPNADTSLKQLSFWIDGFKTVDESYIVSAVISGSRNIYGFPLPPASDRANRRIVEYILRFALKLKYRDVSGKYYKLSEITPEQEANLIRDAMMPVRPLDGSILSTVNSGNDWPDGRGVFHNYAKQVFCWVNDEDHLRVFSRDDGSQNNGKVSLQQMMRDWARTVNILEGILEYSLFNYMHSDKLGFVTSDPSNIGTAMYMSVILRLPKLAEWQIKEITEPKKLSVRPARNVATPGGIWVNGPTVGCWEISTTVCLGECEVDILQGICGTLVVLIEKEKSMLKPLPPPPPPPPPEPEPEPEPVVELPPPPPPPQPTLEDFERDYIKRNTYPGMTVRVTRTKMPDGSVEKYKQSLNLQSSTFAEPRAMRKKMKSNSFTRTRWIWIDHLTKTLHWSKQNSKYETHKEFKLVPVQRITAAPRQWWQTTDPQKQFRLVYDETFYDFELPDSLSAVEMKDWLTALYDSAGFADADSAANGIKRA